MNKILLDNEDIDMILDALSELKQIFEERHMVLSAKALDELVDELTEQSGVGE